MSLNDDIRSILQAKHPEPTPAEERVLSRDEITHVEEVIFENINGRVIQASAMKTFDLGGTTKVDADI